VFPQVFEYPPKRSSYMEAAGNSQRHLSKEFISAQVHLKNTSVFNCDI
jgi:hypothetical protein